MSKKPNLNKEETPLEQLCRIYPKTFQKYGIPMFKQFDLKMKENLDEGTELIQLHLWEESTPNAIKSIFESLIKANVLSLKSIRLWKVNAQDEGVRVLCEYLNFNKEVEILDILDNQLTSFGCQFLKEIYLKNIDTFKIWKLLLDHNNLGDEGLKVLTEGLGLSSSLKELSLSYCGLTQKSSLSIQQLLMFVNTNLIKLNLQGNSIKSEGAYQILRALEVNEKLVELNMSDNEIEDSKLLQDQLKIMLNANNSLYVFNLSFNGIMQETADMILQIVKKKQRPKVELTDRFDEKFVIEYNSTMMKIKPKKEGKKNNQNKKKKK